MERIKIQLSAPFFSGYNLSLTKEIIDDMSINNIIDFITTNLYSLLESNNLEELLQKAKNMKWHIHDDLIKKDGIIYVCDCSF
jgi:hypothetical protein|tara:strand:- start:8241 stop:8489 length:249 start_codon:yes stop_codon:yes gene_type:complete